MAELKPLKGKTVRDTFPKEYLDKPSFRGKTVSYTIKGVFETDVWNAAKGQKVTRLAVTFKETDLILLGSRSDADNIAALLGEAYDSWVGRPLSISAAPDSRNSKNNVWVFSAKGGAQPNAERPQPQPAKKKGRPLSPADLKAALKAKANLKGVEGAIKKPVAQTIAACITRVLTAPSATKEEAKIARDIADAKYHSFLTAVFENAGDPPSATNLTQAQGLATLDWLTDGIINVKAEVGQFAQQEIHLVIEEAMNSLVADDFEPADDQATAPASDNPTDDDVPWWEAEESDSDEVE